MNIEKYEQLEKEMSLGTYEENYKAIERTLFFSSYLGNIASILFAFVFVNKVSSTVHSYISGQQYVLPALIVVFLTAYELLKRFVFRRLAVNLLTQKRKFTIKNLLSVVFSLLLIAGSFYMSVNGARQTVDTTAEVKQNKDSAYLVQKHIVDSTYDSLIASINSKINFSFNTAKTRQSKWGLTKAERADLVRWEGEIKDLRKEKEEKIEELKKSTSDEASEQIVTVKSNMWTFFLISSFIELIILIGVGFNAFYWYYSYNENKLLLQRNPNYKKYKLFSYLLTVLYQSGTKKVDDELPDLENFVLMIHAQDGDATEQDVKDFVTIAYQLGIIKKPNEKVKVAIDYEEAKERVKLYLVIR